MFDAYLAVPYTDKDPQVSEMRYEKVTEIFDALTLRGLAIHSPITVNHRLAPRMGGDWTAWEAIDRKAIPACRIMVIYCMPGWHLSEGINHEVAMAKELNMPVIMLPYGVGIDLAIDILEHEIRRAEGAS
jgi:hypothetical protein